MLRVFNAFQIVVLFAVLPFGIGWLHFAAFPFAAALYWLAIIVYGLTFCGLVAATAHGLGEWK